MGTEDREVVVVIGPGSIGAAIARHVGAGRILLLAAHDETTSHTAADRLRGEGYEVVVQATDISDLAQVEALAAILAVPAG